MSRYALILITILFTMCQSKPEEENLTYDIEGHRGCRGLMPENTLPAFQKALELGVNTLELDLAITKDKQVIVSHEPFFRAGLSIDPDGNAITEDQQLSHNIYNMTFEEVKTYDVGSLPDPKYPERENIKTYKPLFKQVVDKAQHYAFINNRSPLVDFNIEIKRNPKYDNIYHPDAEEFVDLVLAQVEQLDILRNTIIQSFDPESLRIVKMKQPLIRTALLVENDKGAAFNIQNLGFKPDIYSCYFGLLDKAEVDYCHEKEILVIPWTVNEIEDIQAMIDVGTDGIISDYPDRVIKLVRT